MVNRSRNMRKGRSKGRMMRGGDPVIGSNPVAKKSNEAVANNSNEAVANNSNEAVNNIPGVFDGVLESVGNAFTDAKNEGTGFFDEVKNESNGLFGQASNFFTSNTEKEIQENPESIGGYKRSKQMRMKGGKGLGLDYYATSVNGIKVAQPTYMEYYKGGKRRKTCKKRSRRRSCKKRSRTCRRNRRR